MVFEEPLINALAHRDYLVNAPSLHAWYLADPDPVRCLAFYRLAVRLGADNTRWDHAGWVRMPGGMRPKPEGLYLQKIIFLGEHMVDVRPQAEAYCQNYGPQA